MNRRERFRPSEFVVSASLVIYFAACVGVVLFSITWGCYVGSDQEVGSVPGGVVAAALSGLPLSLQGRRSSVGASAFGARAEGASVNGPELRTSWALGLVSRIVGLRDFVVQLRAVSSPMSEADASDLAALATRLHAEAERVLRSHFVVPPLVVDVTPSEAAAMTARSSSQNDDDDQG